MRRGEVRIAAAGSGYAGKPRPIVIVQEDRFDATDSVTICAFTTDPTDAPLFRLRLPLIDRHVLFYLQPFTRLSGSVITPLCSIPLHSKCVSSQRPIREVRAGDEQTAALAWRDPGAIRRASRGADGQRRSMRGGGKMTMTCRNRLEFRERATGIKPAFPAWEV